MRASLVVLSVLCICVTPNRASAQRADASSLRSIVEAVAHDSAAGRRTPSPELDKAAGYIASLLRAAGVDPLGSDRTFIRRYPLTESVLGKAARIEMGATTWNFGDDFFYAAGGGSEPHGVIDAPVSIVAGRPIAGAPGLTELAGRVVLFLSPLTPRGGPADMRSAFALGGAGARAVIIAGGRPDTVWKLLDRDKDEHKPAVEAAWLPFPEVLADRTQRFRPVLELWGKRWDEFVSASGFDTSTLSRSDSTLRVASPGIQSRLVFARDIERVSWAPNVVGVLEGTDPRLKHEYIIVTAHLDGLGSARGRPPGPGSILNGADDNASGIAAMVSLARSLAGSRPKRSVIFAAVSGEENGLWGSDYLAMNPPVPIGQIVANVNMDMIGRARGDTVFLSGQRDPWLGPIVRRVVGDRRDLRLNVLDEIALERRYPGEKADERSDHASFRKRDIPALGFFTGWHDDYHATTDDPPTLNYDALSRITVLIDAVVRQVANAERVPVAGR